MPKAARKSSGLFAIKKAAPAAAFFGGVYSPYAYDGAWNMIFAMQQAGPADPAKVPASVTLYEVRNGKREMVRTTVSEAN